MSQALADLCFPNIPSSVEDIVAQYPSRPRDQMVTRFAPSPTWFLHLWGLYTSLINMQIAYHNQGVFLLRIEDTDQKRFVENGISTIVSLLSYFDVIADEWPLNPDQSDRGFYWPYIQSHRKLIYQIFAKNLISQGKAYPCFMTAQDIEQTRSIQVAAKQLPGIYGDFASFRYKSVDEVHKLIQAGTPYVIRLLSHHKPEDRVEYIDLIKWPISAQANINDIVLIKSDGLTTYHFAHIIDDYLMGVTHVIRADERLPSVPLHIQLYETIWWWSPRWNYAHIAPLLKSDQWNKRKLSKRHDPEADVMNLIKMWYPIDAVKEYLMTIVDSKYEERNNSTQSYFTYPIHLSHMNVAGALVDMLKLDSISKDYIAQLSAEHLYQQVSVWSSDPVWHDYRSNYRDILVHALGIERWNPLKDPKRFITYHDVITHLRPFVDELYIQMTMPTFSLNHESVIEFLQSYIPILDLSMSTEWRFDQLKMVWSQLGYALSNAEYKTWVYKWKIGDLAMILRISLFKATQTPDLYQSMQVMWISRVQKRLQDVVSLISSSS